MSNVDCFTKLALGASVSDLVASCVMTCYQNNKTLVQQLAPEQFVIIQPKGNLILECDNHTDHVIDTHEIGLHGALLLKVPCSCSLS